MRNFNIKRFGRLMQWTVVNDRSVFVKLTITWTIIFFLLFLMVIHLTGYQVRTMHDPYSLYLANALDTAVAVMVCGLLFQPCFIFANLKTKQERINFFMLPSTNLEKYIARFVTVIFIWTLCCLVGFVVADVLQWLVSVILHPQVTGFVMSQIDFSGALSSFYLKSGSSSVSHLCLLLTLILSMLSLHSFYLLGGTFFRRHAWVLTVLVSIVLGMAFSSLTRRAPDSVELANLNQRLYALIAINVLIIVFNYWASFRLFERMQIINNKWVNL